MTTEDHEPGGPPDPTWAAPNGPAAADPDPSDDTELISPVVTPLPGEPPQTGRPWTVRARTAAGVSGVALEIEGRSHDVRLRADPARAGAPPTWSAVVDDIGSDPLRYRFVWRSSWTGDVTEWQTVTPSPPPDETG